MMENQWRSTTFGIDVDRKDGVPLRIEWSHVSKIFRMKPKQKCRVSSRIPTPSIGLLDFSATVRPGITAVLGPKGSGKSTLLRLTAMQLVPDDGRVTYRSDDGSFCMWSKSGAAMADDPMLAKVKQRIGYVPPLRKMDQTISVEHSLMYLAQTRRVPNPKRRAMELIAQWGLGSVRRVPLHELKPGELKRFFLAKSLLADPVIWLLDEPEIGLDEMGRVLLEKALATQPKHRITLLATQDMDLAEWASDLLLMEGGSCRRFGRKRWLTAGVPQGTVKAWYDWMQTFYHYLNQRHS
jgi:ABC-2 type transport system ATP-binding protein